MERFLDYSEACVVARRKATLYGLNMSVRKAIEFGRTGYNVSFAEKFAERGETIRPGEPLSRPELDAEAAAAAGRTSRQA